MSTAYIDDILTFLRIVECGRLSTVAQLQGASVSAVSKSLARLERFVGAPLLLRSPQSIALTAAGQEFHTNCLSSVEFLNKGISAARGLDDRPERRLKVFASLDVGQTLIAPLLFDYIHQNPNVLLDFQMGYREVNILENKIDISICSVEANARRGLGSSNLRQKMLGDIEFKLVTTRKYLDTKGTPKSISDLSSHRIINHTTDAWRFTNKRNAVTVKITPILKSNSWTTLYEATLAGLGISKLPEYMVRAAIRRGDLVVLFPESTPDHREIRAFYPNHKRLAAPVRGLLDYLFEGILETFKDKNE